MTTIQKLKVQATSLFLITPRQFLVIFVKSVESFLQGGLHTECSKLRTPFSYLRFTIELLPRRDCPVLLSPSKSLRRRVYPFILIRTANYFYLLHYTIPTWACRCKIFCFCLFFCCYVLPDIFITIKPYCGGICTVNTVLEITLRVYLQLTTKPPDLTLERTRNVQFARGEFISICYSVYCTKHFTRKSKKQAKKSSMADTHRTRSDTEEKVTKFTIKNQLRGEILILGREVFYIRSIPEHRLNDAEVIASLQEQFQGI